MTTFFPVYSTAVPFEGETGEFHPSDKNQLGWRVAFDDPALGRCQVAIVFASERDAARAAKSLQEAGVTCENFDDLDDWKVYGIMVQDLPW